jgi:uncharacterized protein (DUF3820 family)
MAKTYTKDRNKPFSYPEPYWSKHNLLDTKIWFGKHRGTKFKDLPIDYIRFLVNLPNKSHGFLHKLESYLIEREKALVES